MQNNSLIPNKKKLGIVKWFNMELRYGFITVLDTDVDYFIHKNNILSDANHKCLFKGEYVELDIIETPKGLQCSNVSGLNKGKLLFESNPELLKKYILGEYIQKTNPNLNLFRIVDT